MSILSYFPEGYTPSPLQEWILLEVERLWEAHEVIVIEAAVAVGKSFLSRTIVAWQGGGSIIVPNNLLLDQMVDDFPDLSTLRAKNSYICPKGDDTSAEVWTCTKQVKATGFRCNNCPQERDRIRDAVSSEGVYTYYGYYSNKKYRNILVCDEAHKITGWLRELNTKTLRYSNYNWPEPATPETLLTWVNAEKKRVKALGKEPNKALTALQSNLNGRAKHSIAYKVTERVKGVMEPTIKISPAICSGSALWPGHKVGKIVLMSATISKLDVLQLGLTNRSVARIQAGSPIPPERRPVQFTREVEVTWENREKAAYDLAQAILRISYLHPEEAGIVHVPYSLSEGISQYLKENFRFIFHTRERESKKEKLAEFLQSGNGILIASGFAEGINLSHEKARFNIVTKLSVPNNQDPFVQQMTEKFPLWPIEQGVTHLVQAYGRTTRKLNDYSKTYVLDEQAYKIYKRYPKMFPAWFHSSVIP